MTQDVLDALAGAITPTEFASGVYGGTPVAIDPDDAGAAGVATTLSRSDHAHEFLTAAASALTLTTTSSEGTSGDGARADHVHSTAALPWGERARFVATGNNAHSADGTTDFAIANFVAPGNRKYRVWLMSQINLSAAGDWLINFHVDGTLTKQIGRMFSTVAWTIHGVHSCYWAPAAGTYNLDLRVDEISGTSTLTFNGNASGLEREFWIEDIGPV